jgi:plasmid stabilization system protein ParE
VALALRRAEFFVRDFDLQYRRYLEEADAAVAERYFEALETTLEQLARHPALGRIRRFKHVELKGIRSYRVSPPFHKHLIFYRYDADALIAERVVHGARDLPRRLAQPPETVTPR